MEAVVVRLPSGYLKDARGQRGRLVKRELGHSGTQIRKRRSLPRRKERSLLTENVLVEDENRPFVYIIILKF